MKTLTHVRRGAMNRFTIPKSLPGLIQGLLVALLLCLVGQAHALVAGWEGEAPSAANGNTRIFNLTARDDFISTSDGGSHYAWGYAHGAEYAMQYPGPTLIVNQGDTVKIVLNNSLPVPVSIIFPGQQGVTATGGKPGLLTREAPAAAVGQNTIVGGPTYTFVASQPGTYLYHSGTQADLQVEMGLVGALIVRPNGFAYGDGSGHPARKAYEQPGTQYDRETLFLLSEMDPAVHWQVYGQVYSGQPISVDTTQIKPSMWFINGRNAPDTQLDDYVYWLPTQPYNSLPRMHPGERLLMRVVNAGRDLHPFHHHGNHATAIARDGRVLSSNPSLTTQAPDLTAPDYTVRSVPGQTVDLIYEWTGQGIGWDIYGSDSATQAHSCNGKPLSNTPGDPGVQSAGFDSVTHEDCTQHGKAIPVIIPSQLDIASGEHYGGSPFLGQTGSLPQGHPGLNTTGGYYHMLHSHNEKEVTTDDIFPGGMMTMLVVEPWSVDLDNGTATAAGGGAGTPPPTPLAIPALSVLDDFTRTGSNANNLGPNWLQSNSNIRVRNNQADASNNGNAYWNVPTSGFGQVQGAAFTFVNNTTRNGAALYLKAAGTFASGTYRNAIRVRYSTSNGGQVIVETTTNGQPYTNAATLSNASFSNNDRLTALAEANGKVTVWKTAAPVNGVPGVTTVLGTASTPFTGLGSIGMSLPNNARVDNFAGGTL
jgi:FtsP/CotA-like multicopper oxidase with cupredoxin domain